MLATSDLPGGVANMLTGRAAELAPWLAAHADVQALDLTGAPAELAAELERGRGGHRQAGAAAPGRRAGPDPRHPARPAARVHRDQDGLAPGRALTPARA